MHGFRGLQIGVLLALTVSTLLGLVPLYGTKVVFDNVLRDNPLPSNFPRWIHIPTDRRILLTVVATDDGGAGGLLGTGELVDPLADHGA